ncbi:MAG: GAF domain-containing protein [Anaerolineales bacterium]
MNEKKSATSPEAMRRLATLLDQSHDAIMLLASESGQFCEANQTACRLLGYERDALLGTPATALQGAQARPWVAALSSALRTSPPPRSKIVVHKGEEGAPIIYDLAIHQANFEGTSYLLAAARDITHCDLATRDTHVGRIISSQSDLPQVLKTIARYAAKLCRADVSCVVAFNSDLELMASSSSGMLGEDITCCASDILQHGAYKQMLLENQSVHLPDEKDTHLEITLAEQDIHAALFVPILQGEQLTGLIFIGQHAQHDFTGKEQLYLQTLAHQAAIAIENARLFAAQCAQREVTEALEAAASIVTSTLDLDQVLDRILEQTARVVNGDAFNIMLIEEDNVRIVRWRGYESLSDNLQPKILHNALETYPNLLRMLQTGRPIISPDTVNDPHWVAAPQREWRRSYVAAPIQISGETVGFLNVNGTQPYQFDAYDAQRLKAFADHAAIAIQNARHYERQRHYADELEQRVQQRTLLLQAQKAWLEAILSSTTDAIMVTDGDGQIVQSNRVARTWLRQLLPPDEVTLLQAQIRELAHQANERPKVVIELSGIDLQLNAAPISEQDTTGPAVVIVGHDVTPLKALERMKSRFISNASHELRTPIASIQLYVSLLRNAPPQRREQYFAALDREVAQISRLVEDILEISRVDAARLDFDPQPVNFDHLTATAVASYQLLAESRGVTLSYQALTPGVRALIDADKFSHVVGNLIVNAINYTPAGGYIEVHTAEATHDERPWAVLIIADTGTGILDSEMKHIFERFYRGAASRMQQVQGSGLGLAIVKEIVELHGGRVTVESQVNVGTTFTVRVPLA